MSRIDALIAELCPEGVEFKEIQELFITKNGYTPSTTNKAYWTDGTVPWFRMEDIRENGRILSESMQQITEEAVKGGRLFPAHSIIVATSATIGEHALITVPHLSNQRFTSLALKPDYAKQLDMKFIFYYCFVLNDWCRNNTTTSSFASVDMNGFKRFRFPVPPLEVQREIVKVLDTFTQLEAELEAELEARRRQYQYYRDALLSFDTDASHEGMKTRREEVRWATLGDIGKVSMCKRVFKSETSRQGEIPFYKIGTFGGTPDAFISRGLYQEYKSRYSFPKKGDILISAAGTIGRAIPYDGEDAYFQDSNIVWIDNDESLVTNKYLWHWYQVVQWTTDGGTIQRLYNENLRQTKIAIPSLSEQARIVAILDQFDALVNDLSSGLPAEIRARRQQYEHYRDRLLSFREAA